MNKLTQDKMLKCLMNRILQKSLIFFSLVLFANPALAEVNLIHLVNKIMPAVATVITYDMDKKVLGRGSGFFVDEEGHLITNCHVIKGGYTVDVKLYDGKVYPVDQVVAENQTIDLAKVSVDIPENFGQWLEIAKDLPAVGERLVVVSSPMGLEHTVSEGIVSAVREMPHGGKFVQISAPISPGSSGGPVVNMEGKVIGVVTFQMQEGQNLNFALTGEQVLSLKQKDPGKEISKWAKEGSCEAAKELCGKGLNFFLSRDYEKALTFLKRATEICSRLAWFGSYYAGKCYHELGRFDHAVAVYKYAIQLNPNVESIHHDLAFAYLALGLNRDAIETYKEVIRLNPKSATAYYDLGCAYLLAADRSGALEQYEILKNLDRNLADRLYTLIW